MERRYSSGGEVRADAGPSGGGISGYASVYWDGSRGTEYLLHEGGGVRLVEHILPGAFDRALREHDDAAALFNHDPDNILGRVSAGTLVLSSDRTGLRYRIYPPETTLARDLRESIRRGDVPGSSFAFVVDEESFVDHQRRDGTLLVVREVRSVTLLDVGPVTFAAYSGTTTHAGG